jgi:hypothetical protein
VGHSTHQQNWLLHVSPSVSIGLIQVLVHIAKKSVVEYQICADDVKSGNFSKFKHKCHAHRLTLVREVPITRYISNQ